MYLSYALSVVFFSVIFCLGCVGSSEVSRKNCSGYQQVFKENLRNGVVDSGETQDAESIDNPASSQTFKNTTEDLQNSWEIELTNKTALTIEKHENDITLKIAKLSTSIEARKKKMQVMDIIPYLIIPGFISAGILPWLIPGMKMAVMGVAMINQMAFTSSLFSLIRGYIFDTSQEEHVVYVNHGYEKYKHKNHFHSHR